MCRLLHGRQASVHEGRSLSGLARGAVILHLGRDPIVEQMRWPIHRGRKPTPVKRDRVTTALHAFDDKDILGKDFFPLLRVACAQIGIGAVFGVIEVNMFNSLFRALRHQNDGKGVIAVNA